MKIFQSIAALNQSINGQVVAIIGNFDGVHIGHQSLLQEVVTHKSDEDRLVVVTFKPHPDFIIKKNKNFLITNYDEKYQLLEQCGVDYVFEVHFNEGLRNQDPTEFFNEHILAIKGLSTFYFGEDFSLGKNRCFGINDALNVLELRGIVGKKLNKLLVGEKVVSSTLIRDLIDKANFEEVSVFLGRPYDFAAKVVDGKKIGRRLNFKTANLLLNTDQKYPQVGVYAALVKVDEDVFWGAMNVGTNPTISSEESLKIEVHILNFEKEIYNLEISVRPIQKIRDEICFNSLEELKEQIRLDIERVKGLRSDSSSIDW